MDAKTLALIGFDQVRLLVAKECSSTLGRELAESLDAIRDQEELQKEHHRVEEMKQAIRKSLTPQLGDARDVRLSLRRAALGSQLTIDELLEVARTLDCTGQIYRWKMRLDGDCLRLIEFLSPLEDMGAHAKTIHGCIDSRGHVLDMASPELAQVRRSIHEVDEKVKTIMNRLLRDPEIRRILRFQQVSVVGEHQVLAVAANHRHKVQGVMHRSSSSGDTVFIEPAAVANLAAERSLLRDEETREINKVLRRLSAEVSKISGPLGFALGLLGRLDLIQAKARLALDLRMVKPHLNSRGVLALKDARHPLIELEMRQAVGTSYPGDASRSEIDRAATQVVPISLQLGNPQRLLIITGPNTGGKTASLKTVGLMCWMGLAGVQIPAAEGSTLPILEGIFADIGEEQNLAQSLSSFSSHIARIGWILPRTGPNTLVLLDELGTGTDPAEGSAMGRAILDELGQKQCLALISTHLGDLKRYPKKNPFAANAAMEFDPETLLPTFRLLMGRSGKSNALKIARRFHLPESLIQKARRYLGLGRRKKKTQALRTKVKREQPDIDPQALNEAIARERQKEMEARELEKQRLKEAREKAINQARESLKPGDWVDIPKFGQPGQVVRCDTRKKMLLVQVGLGQWEIPMMAVNPRLGSD